MYMKPMEIVNKFKKADDKKEILQVLADLNVCSTEDMKSYLLEHGISEDEFPKKRGRKPKVAEEETKKSAKEKVPHIEPVKTVDQLMKMPELTSEEQSRVARALAIPEPVLRVITDRIESLTAKIMEMEKERDCLCDYLEGEVPGEAS